MCNSNETWRRFKHFLSRIAKYKEYFAVEQSFLKLFCIQHDAIVHLAYRKYAWKL